MHYLTQKNTRMSNINGCRREKTEKLHNIWYVHLVTFTKCKNDIDFELTQYNGITIISYN